MFRAKGNQHFLGKKIMLKFKNKGCLESSYVTAENFSVDDLFSLVFLFCFFLGLRIKEYCQHY